MIQYNDEVIQYFIVTIRFYCVGSFRLIIHSPLSSLTLLNSTQMGNDCWSALSKTHRSEENLQQIHNNIRSAALCNITTIVTGVKQDTDVTSAAAYCTNKMTTDWSTVLLTWIPLVVVLWKYN